MMSYLAAADLDALNAAWTRIMRDGGRGLGEDAAIYDCFRMLLSEYEAGKRGDDLVAWWYSDPEEGDENDDLLPWPPVANVAYGGSA